MDCRETKLILDAYVAGELSDEKSRAVREHLSQCADCRRSEAEYKDALDALKRADKDAPLPDAVFYRGLARRLDEVDRYAGRRPAQPIRWYFVGSVAAAAAAVYILSVYVIPSVEQKSPSERQPPVAVIETPRSPQFASTPAATAIVPVSASNRSVSDQDNYVYVRGPRLEFPRYATPPLAPLFQEGNYVTLDDYSRLEKRLMLVEARLTALEGARATQPAK